MNKLIQQARELCEKATTGPWDYSPAGHIYAKDTGFIDTVAFVGACGKQAVRDTAFIAASRTLVPQLCDALEAAQKEIERLQGELQDQEYQITLDAMKQSRDEAIARAEKAEAENRWIPVRERLPDKCGYYLTCDRKGNIHIFSHDPECDYPFFIRPDSERYYQPTHWRPLPEPPKKGE